MSFQKEHALVKQCIENITDINGLSSSFYTHLFRINPNLTKIFHGGVPMLNRKFNSMLSTFKSVHDLQTIASAIQGMAKRHVGYHAEVAHFEDFNQALDLALQSTLKEAYTTELKQAWATVFKEVAGIMTAVIEQQPAANQQNIEHQTERPLIDDIGGADLVTAIHQRFYDYMYDDEYIGGFFQHRAKSLLIRKQTEFMVAAFGGENLYTGEPPAFIHMHMFITKEMSDIRDIYLRKAILEEGLNDELCQRWMAVDASFHDSIEKTNIDECVMRVWGQYPFSIKKPASYSPPKLA